MNSLQVNHRQIDTAHHEDLMERLRSESVEALKAQLIECMGHTAKSLLRMACLVRALEEKGEDLGGLKLGLIHHLRKIACGTLLPEVVLQFAGKPSLIAVVGGLPLSDQKKLAEGKTVKVVVYDQQSKDRTHRLIDPLDLTPSQVKQVFARDHIRREEEQLAILDDRREKAMLPIPETVGRMKVDRALQGVTIGRYFIPLSELETVVRLLRG